MSLRKRSNKKSVSAEAREPKLRRWHARFRRRLGRYGENGPSKRSSHSDKSVTSRDSSQQKSDQAASSSSTGIKLPSSLPSDQAASSSSTSTAPTTSRRGPIVNTRGFDVKLMVSTQASHVDSAGVTWREDCGLCAVKNVTVQPDFTLSDLLAVIETKNQESKDQQSPPSLFEHGKGNFSGAALTMLMGQRATRALANGAHLQTTLNSNALSLGSEWLEWCGVL